MDIDGCIFEPSGRRHHFLAGDEDAYHRDWHTDVPKPQGIALYEKFLFDSRYQCLFITGRNERARDYTTMQLESVFGKNVLGLTGTYLMMRPSADKDMPDIVLKPLLLNIAGYVATDVFLAFDDRQCIVDMWRS